MLTECILVEILQIICRQMLSESERRFYNAFYDYDFLGFSMILRITSCCHLLVQKVDMPQ